MSCCIVGHSCVLLLTGGAMGLHGGRVAPSQPQFGNHDYGLTDGHRPRSRPSQPRGYDTVDRQPRGYDNYQSSYNRDSEGGRGGRLGEIESDSDDNYRY